MQPRLIISNEVETKDLCTVRYSSTSNKALLFCGFEVFRAFRSSYLHRLCSCKMSLKLKTLSVLSNLGIGCDFLEVIKNSHGFSLPAAVFISSHSLSVTNSDRNCKRFP